MQLISRSWVVGSVAAMVILALLCGMGANVYAAAQKEEAEEGSKASEEGKTSEVEYPKKMKAHQGWEWFLYIPGYVIFLPFKLIFEGVGYTAGYVHEKKLVQRVRDIFATETPFFEIKPTYSNRSGFGLKFERTNILNKNSELEVRASIGYLRRQRYEVSLQRVNLFTERVKTDILVGYRLMPNESFFGIGPDSPQEYQTNYMHERVYTQLALATFLGEKVNLAANLGFDYNNILDGRDPDLPSTTNIYDPSELPGLETKVKFVSAQFAAIYNSKRITGEKIRGHEVLLGGGVFNQVGDEKYGFYQLRADFNSYFHLFYGRNVILRLSGQIIEPFDNRTVPFYLLSEIGRRETVRGFTRGRFYDLDKFVGSLEYQYPIWRNYLAMSTVDALLFIDFGQVARDIGDINTDNSRIGAGIGIRLWNPKGEWARVMIAKSRERWRFYFVLN